MNNQTTSPLVQNTYAIKAPSGVHVNIPVDYEAATDVYCNFKSYHEISDYYQTNGYVVARKLIPDELCDKATASFQKEMKTYKGFVYRQATANPEKHVFTEHNHMLNAVMNLQDLNKKKFSQFREASLQTLTHPNLKAFLNILMRQEAILVQTMYFEGNPATWPHQDKDYLDAMQPGKMVGAWVALEDIKPGAGRFYVYPKSHKINIEKIGKNLNIILDREAYQKLVVETINNYELECRAPALKKGDVLFWHGQTIHGSLPTTQPEFSRSSFTGHYIPTSKSLLQLQVREKKLKLREVYGIGVNFPKDQNLLVNQAVFALETSFPKLFKTVKKKAIKLFST